MSADARELADWLLGQERLQRSEAQTDASQMLTTFLDDLLCQVDFREYNVEDALESFFSTFASGVTRHVLRSSAPGGHGLSEAVRNGTERALAVTAAALVELVDALEEDEFAPVAPTDVEEMFSPPTDAAELIEQQEATEPIKARLTRSGGKR